MNSLTVLVVSYKMKEYLEIMINSFEKFKPQNFTVEYVIVENSDDKSYEEHIKSLNNNISWFYNPIGIRETNSYGHGTGYELGKKHVKSDWTWVAHGDVCVTNKSFYSELKNKVKEGCSLIGVNYDAHPGRIAAAFCSGYLVETEILKKASMLPKLPKYDTTDLVTKYCRDNNKKIHIFNNTYNKPEMNSLINQPFKSWGPNCGIDRCLDSNNQIMYMHLGRGTTKKQGTYYKQGKKLYSDWIEICEQILSAELDEERTQNI
jgi:hypothetical protein